uniref:Aminomethyltransferase folate-binding domain-containing protein n=1 Tax=Eiseniibacteriota bacterium TaxID=2212470 RepID=A0A832I2K9_UNCEI
MTLEPASAATPFGAAPPASAALRIEGADALAVLHRISTARLDDLVPGAARWTLFCDFRGRLLHRAAVAVTEDAVWLLRPDAAAAELAAWVDRHVFRERVRLVDASAAWRVEEREESAPALAPGTLAAQDGVPRLVRPDDGPALALAPAATARAAEDPGAPLRRVRAGRPRHGHEIAPEFTPYEVGLAHEVHLSKGCYTGQEALLRLMTYASVRRRLVRLGARGRRPRRAPRSRAARSLRAS